MLVQEVYRTPAGDRRDTYYSGGQTYLSKRVNDWSSHYATDDNGVGETHNIHDHYTMSHENALEYGPKGITQRFQSRHSAQHSTQADYSPSTYEEFIYDPEHPQGGYLTTYTNNYTVTHSTNDEAQHGSTYSVEDSKSVFHWSSRTKREVDGVVAPPGLDWEDKPYPMQGKFETVLTEHGANTFVQRVDATAGDLYVVKPVSTEANLRHWTTRSYTYTVATTPDNPQGTASSWTIEVSDKALPTTLALVQSGPWTYPADSVTHNTMTTRAPGAETNEPPITVAATNEIVTGHYFNQWMDYLVLNRNGKGAGNFNKGDRCWVFTADKADNAVVPYQHEMRETTGRFSDLFGKFDERQLTVTHLRKLVDYSHAVTYIRRSVSSKTVVEHYVDGEKPDLEIKTRTAQINAESLNGRAWNTWETYQTTDEDGPAIGGSVPDSCFKNETFRFNCGAQGDYLYTVKQGDEVFTHTALTHTIQVSGYDSSNRFTTGIETLTDYGVTTSYSTQVHALFEPIEVRTTLQSLTSATDYTFYSSNHTWVEGTVTMGSFVGWLYTETTRHFFVEFTTTAKEWLDEFNQIVDQYVTVDSSTAEHVTYGQTETLSDIGNVTAHTIQTYSPHLRSVAGDVTPGAPLIHYEVTPAGIVGFLGSFAPDSLKGARTLQVDRLSGSAFTGCTIKSEHLPSVLVRESVTGFPADPAVKILDIPNAASARYLSSVENAGDPASIAVTWVSTTVSNGDTIQTYRSATYQCRTAESISGKFYHWAEMDDDAGWKEYRPQFYRQAQYLGGWIGSFWSYSAAGDNALGNAYTVSVQAGFCQWTEYASTNKEPKGTHSTSGSSGNVTFTVPASHAIRAAVEPIYTARWEDGGSPYLLIIEDNPHLV